MEKYNSHESESSAEKNTRDKTLGEAALKNSNIEDTKTWAKYYYNAEKSFEKRAENGTRIEYEELLEWEDRASFPFERMEKYAKSSHFPSRYERDKAENIGILDPDKSIEAESGNFYLRRQRALNKAIEESNDKDKEKDLKAGEELYRYVGEHLYYEHDYETLHSDSEVYQSKRRAAHNALINHLNHMNNLARKYSVRPFTLRNFEDNDFPYSGKFDIGGHTNARAEYDRSTVEAYCRNAFSSAYEKAERDSR